MTRDASPRTERLVAGAKAGDPEALQALYDRYRHRVLSVVRVRMGSLLRSRMESQDLVQSVMLESLKDLGSFEYRTEGAFLHWLSTLAERKIRDKVDYLSAKRRDAGAEAELPAGDEEPLAETRLARSPSQLAAQAEELLRLEEAIRRLPKEQTEMLVMAKLEGLSYGEIAGLTGKSEAAVRMLVVRAITALTALMKAPGPAA